MNLSEAAAECRRWLDYLERQKQKTAAMQKLASERRAGSCSHEEARRRLNELDRNLTVYDGARLADAVRRLLAYVGE